MLILYVKYFAFFDDIYTEGKYMTPTGTVAMEVYVRRILYYGNNDAAIKGLPLPAIQKQGFLSAFHDSHVAFSRVAKALGLREKEVRSLTSLPLGVNGTSAAYDRLRLLAADNINAIETRLRAIRPDLDPHTEGGMEEILKLGLALSKVNYGFYLREDVARRLLEALPPEKTMRSLGYEDVKQMLASEDVFKVFSVSRYVESKEWLEGFIERYKGLTPADFEFRPIRTFVLEGKYAFAYPAMLKKYPASDDKMIGTVYAVPVPNQPQYKVPLLRSLTRTLHYLYEVDMYSGYNYRLQYWQHTGIGRERLGAFGEVISRVMQGILDTKANNPHLLVETFCWNMVMRRLIDQFSAEVPELCAWESSHVAGIETSGKTPRTISLNLIDVLSMVAKGLTEFYSLHLRRNVSTELGKSYMRAEDFQLAYYQTMPNIHLGQIEHKNYSLLESVLARKGNSFIFIGAPASKKTVTAKQVAEAAGLNLISFGDILRTEISNSTPLATEYARYVNNGKLVPNELAYKLLIKAFDALPEGENFVLEGFPRDLEQAKFLEKILIARGISSTVLFTYVDPATGLDRVIHRRVCPQCGDSYHEIRKPPKNAGVCDRDGYPLITRRDDNPQIFLSRLAAFNQTIGSLLEFYGPERIRSVDSSIPNKI